MSKPKLTLKEIDEIEKLVVDCNVVIHPDALQRLCHYARIGLKYEGHLLSMKTPVSAKTTENPSPFKINSSDGKP